MAAVIPIARFDDRLAGTVVQFSSAERIITATTSQQVEAALAEVEDAVAAGLWAFGCLAYEAASGLDPTLEVADPVPGLPLLWFGLASQPDRSPAPLPHDDGPSPLGARWRIKWDQQRHAEAVAAVHEAIAAGETYQCNLTTSLTGILDGDLFDHYAALVSRQAGAFNAWLNLGSHQILSASPECFFQRNGDLLLTRPMKGTAARHVDPAADLAARRELSASAKERAENIMIVDLLRNDLSQVSEPGSVEVTQLLAVEPYPTVWQLTSTICSTARKNLSLVELFRALFPCGSVTGAPKGATMRLIRTLEDGPRGIYCGAIGFLSPGAERRASFSVPIRTVTVEAATGMASYGVGSGVTWSSTADQEYAEVLAKARVLGVPSCGICETLAIDDGQLQHLKHHLARLERSAQQLGLFLDREQLMAEIEQHMSGHHGAGLMRIELNHAGVAITVRQRQNLAEPVRLAVDLPTVDPADPLTRVKITDRRRFEAARARFPEADDVILVNHDLKLTETTIANLAVKLDGIWFTPPTSDGCLPGIGRELALAAGQLRRRSLSVDDLSRAEAIAVISSARGWRVGLLL